MQPVIALLHSPLAGPLTWAPVSRALRRRGTGTVIPFLADDGGRDVPFWVQHASAVAHSLESLPADSSLILAGHSGAGPLLPAIATFSPHPVAGYIFVDAGLPHPGQSRLQDLEAAESSFGKELRADLEAGVAFPQWTDEDLREIIRDAALRRGVLAELQPRDLAFFTEPLPHVENWSEAKCAYVRFSPAYDVPAQQAREAGWPVRQFDAGHFHMLVDAPAVAEAILQLVESLLEREGRAVGPSPAR
ncbi:MAG: hypothetical protein ACRDFX_08260 [Chloroflexota bacterium]